MFLEYYVAIQASSYRHVDKFNDVLELSICEFADLISAVALQHHSKRTHESFQIAKEWKELPHRKQLTRCAVMMTTNNSVI